MIGIDISDNSIKLVELRGTRSTFETLNWSFIPDGIVEQGLIQDTVALRETIQYTLEHCVPAPAHSREAVVSLPERHTFLQVLSVPTMSDAETDEAVSWAVRPHLPYDFEQMYVSWQPLGDSSPAPAKTRSVIVAASLKSAIDPLVETFRSLPLILVAIEASSQALVRNILPSSSPDSRSIVILDMGATSTNVVFVRGGSTQMSTSLNGGGQNITQAIMKQLGLPRELAERKKVQLGIATRPRSEDEKIVSVIREQAGALAADIRDTIKSRVASHSYLRPPELLILAGGTANLPNIDTVIREVFPSFPFQFAQPWATINVSSGIRALNLSDEDARHFVIASGLAQRRHTKKYESSDHAINLLPPAEQHALLRSVALSSLERLISVSLVAGFALTIFGVLLLLTLTLLSRIAPAPDDAALAAAIARNQEVAASYRSRNELLSRIATLSRETVLWTEYLSHILQALPPGLRVHSVRGRYEGRQAVLSGVASSRSAIQVAEQALSALPQVSEIISPPTNFLKQSDADFRLELTLKHAAP